MSEELKPCPFCGLAPRMILEGPHGEQETHVFCVCPMEPIAIVDGANNLEGAAAIWNRRTPDAAREKRMREVAEALLMKDWMTLAQWELEGRRQRLAAKLLEGIEAETP